MKCNDFEKLIPLYHDGELSEKKKSEFEKHLEKCSACKAKLQELNALDALVRDGESESVPDPGEHYWHSFTNRLSRRLTDSRHMLVHRPRRKLLGWRLLPYLSAGVAVVFAIVIGIELIGRAPAKFSQMKEIEELGKVDLKREQGIAKTDKSQSAPVASNERAVEMQSRAGYYASEAEAKMSVPIPAMPEENKELVSAYDVDDIAKDESISSSTEGAELQLAQEKTANAEQGGGRRSSEEAGKAIVAGTISDINNKIKENESSALGGAAKETKSARTTKAAAPSVGTIAKSYPENAIVFDRQFSEGGTLRVVVDSTGKLAEVTIYRSSGDAKVDSQAIAAYKKQWSGQVLRQRQTTLYIPFGQKQTDTKND
ncbi:hypothetical protein GX441_06965 [bacterium]|nr:hypothetical protein [bacterium]